MTRGFLPRYFFITLPPLPLSNGISNLQWVDLAKEIGHFTNPLRNWNRFNHLGIYSGEVFMLNDVENDPVLLHEFKCSCGENFKVPRATWQRDCRLTCPRGHVHDYGQSEILSTSYSS